MKAAWHHLNQPGWNQTAVVSDAIERADLDILATTQSGTQVFRGNATATGEPEETQ